MAKGIFVSIVIRKCYTTRRETKEKGKEDVVTDGGSGWVWGWNYNETTVKEIWASANSIFPPRVSTALGIERRNINILESPTLKRVI
jgi:hypothetical protein